MEFTYINFSKLIPQNSPVELVLLLAVFYRLKKYKTAEAQSCSKLLSGTQLVSGR